MIPFQWIYFALIWCFIISTSTSQRVPVNRTKLGYEALWDLNEMAECKLHYTALDYNNYGCWCGVGGSGKPADPIDACCMAHDKCYDSAVDNNICENTEWEYIDPYSFTCQDGEPECGISLTGCKAALCHCDKNVVDCWSKYPKPTVKVKCTHADGGILDHIIAAVKTIVHFLASIPKIVISYIKGILS